MSKSNAFLPPIIIEYYNDLFGRNSIDVCVCLRTCLRARVPLILKELEYSYVVLACCNLWSIVCLFVV